MTTTAKIFILGNESGEVHSLKSLLLEILEKPIIFTALPPIDANIWNHFYNKDFQVINVIIDDLDNPELYHQLKTTEKLKDIPTLIICTNTAKNLIYKQILEADTDVVMCSPFEAFELGSIIKVLLNLGTNYTAQREKQAISLTTSEGRKVAHVVNYFE